MKSTFVIGASLFLISCGSGSPGNSSGEAAKAEPGPRLFSAKSIHITSAVYGDGSADNRCSPSLALCEGRSLCEFQVTDGLCALPAGAGSARNLEVQWTCGSDEPRARAAAKGTQISLSC